MAEPMEDRAENYGWGFPSQARKAHYFDADGRSLCGRYGLMPKAACESENAHRRSPDDCAECRRRFDSAYGRRAEEAPDVG